ncbi:phosphotransferase [Bacillus alveayuensis]|uniref:phosphotransferase n=1 Tax=Aeribacillus alveayuensis TaxID=279215 RepID=UPI0005CCD489|nr:phosphotransferase [Bacillus alveayuensis]
MDLQFLFAERIKEIQELSPGYEDHASDVWLVKTDREEVIVRSSRMVGEPSNDFWWGCKRLFGIDPRNVHELEHINNILSECSTIPIPKVLKKGTLSREYVVVEKLAGQVVKSFIGQPDSLLQSLGEGLAHIHQHQRQYIGNPSGTFQVKLEHFHNHLINVMKELVSKFYRNNQKIVHKLDEVIEILKEIRVPDYSTFVLVDMDPTQFLSDGKAITGLVDTEAYVIAPREMDFIGLEYILDKKAAAAFKEGYEKVMKIPDLTEYRLPYRYLYRLLSVQGSVDLDHWLNQEILF